MLPERRKAEWVLATLTVVVMLKFYGHELVLGQMNVLFAVLVAAAAVSLKADREADKHMRHSYYARGTVHEESRRENAGLLG